MKGTYPRFKATYAHDELVEHVLLNPSERDLIDSCRNEVNQHGGSAGSDALDAGVHGEAGGIPEVVQHPIRPDGKHAYGAGCSVQRV